MGVDIFFVVLFLSHLFSDSLARRNVLSFSVRAQMARNFAFNKAARKKMNKFLLAKMAANAKKAKKDLDDAMRRTQAQFAAAATLANQRNAANIARSKKIRATVARNKAEAAQNAHVNARIDQTNKHVAANAAQIKED